jgi:hypothetical protein
MRLHSIFEENTCCSLFVPVPYSVARNESEKIVLAKVGFHHIVPVLQPFRSRPFQ